MRVYFDSLFFLLNLRNCIYQKENNVMENYVRRKVNKKKLTPKLQYTYVFLIVSLLSYYLILWILHIEVTSAIHVRSPYI